MGQQKLALEKRIREAEDVINSQEKALEKATAAIRDQTEADLILNVLRLLGILPSRSKSVVKSECRSRWITTRH